MPLANMHTLRVDLFHSTREQRRRENLAGSLCRNKNTAQPCDLSTLVLIHCHSLYFEPHDTHFVDTEKLYTINKLIYVYVCNHEFLLGVNISPRTNTGEAYQNCGVPDFVSSSTQFSSPTPPDFRLKPPIWLVQHAIWALCLPLERINGWLRRRDTMDGRLAPG
jgi:hypothetical protein